MWVQHQNQQSFFSISSPASSHLIARLEVATDEEKEKHYRIVPLKELEKELAEQKEELQQAELPQEKQQEKEDAVNAKIDYVNA